MYSIELNIKQKADKYNYLDLLRITILFFKYFFPLYISVRYHHMSDTKKTKLLKKMLYTWGKKV